MLDIKLIRKNPKIIKEALQKRGVKLDIDMLLEIDKKRLETLQAIEDMRAKKNKASKEIVVAKTQREKKKIILEMQELDRGNDRLDKDIKMFNERFEKLMYQIPNIQDKNVPLGKSDKNNKVIGKIGKKPKHSFKAKDYLEIAEKLDIIDVKRAAKVSGSRFGYLKGDAVLLEFALVNLALDVLTKQGFIPIVPPVLIKPEIMKAMGYIDSKQDLAERYYLAKEKLFLVGTGEQSIGPMHKDEIFSEKDLPRRYAAFSTCFREEAGSYGKDTKGILRVHQFDKVEMFSFCKPQDSKKEHKYLLSLEEELVKILKIPYRIVQMCTGDLARPSSITYDLEMWMPGQKKYRETHSVSNCTDFQTRRLNIRYKDNNGKLNFVHSLNGTAFAIGRTIIAIIENYQQEDGSVRVPDILQKYMNKKKTIS